VAHRQTIEALPQQLPSRHELIHQCDEMRVVRRFDHMQHFMHQNVFEAFVRLLRDFRVETNGSRSRICSFPISSSFADEDAIHPHTQWRLLAAALRAVVAVQRAAMVCRLVAMFVYYGNIQP
jgi:hypothetical protein